MSANDYRKTRPGYSNCIEEDLWGTYHKCCGKCNHFSESGMCTGGGWCDQYGAGTGPKLINASITEYCDKYDGKEPDYTAPYLDDKGEMIGYITRFTPKEWSEKIVIPEEYSKIAHREGQLMFKNDPEDHPYCGDCQYSQARGKRIPSHCVVTNFTLNTHTTPGICDKFVWRKDWHHNTIKVVDGKVTIVWHKNETK